MLVNAGLIGFTLPATNLNLATDLRTTAVAFNTATRQVGTLQLTDVGGKRILLQHVILINGVNQVALTDLSRLSSGSYYLLITTESGIKRKLIQLSWQ